MDSDDDLDDVPPEPERPDWLQDAEDLVSQAVEEPHWVDMASRTLAQLSRYREENGHRVR